MIKLILSKVLQELVRDQLNLTLEKKLPKPLISFLKQAVAASPELFEKLFDVDGHLRKNLSAFINGRDIRFLDGESTLVEDDAEVLVMTAISGG